MAAGSAQIRPTPLRGLRAFAASSAAIARTPAPQTAQTHLHRTRHRPNRFP